MTTWTELRYPGRAASFFEHRPLPRFHPDAPGYDAGNAWWLAELSRIVYRHDHEENGSPPEPLRSAFLAEAGLRQLKFFHDDVTDTQGFLVRADGPPALAALVFRGTEQRIKDFLTDLMLWKKPIGNHTAHAHQGFVAALDRVWSSVAAELATLDCPVFFAGHSLGGALATIAAARHAPRALYTFGSPRVGNAAFAETLSGIPVYRVVDHDDDVTKQPSAALGYAHVGELHRLVRPPEDGGRGLLSWLGRRFRPWDSLADHAPVNYVRRLALTLPA